jgi:pimeloyl-ACP methyl ester carboxylesterase
MASMTVNGVDLYYTIEGTGPSLVLVHGSWGDADNWAPVVPQLARQCAVVAYDRRGHSRSERSATQGSVHDDVADLAALIETLDLAPAFVCGNSYGALITLRLAVTRADLVRGIAVHEPPGVPVLLGDPAFALVVEAFTGRMAPVRVLLEASEYAAAAERFVETIALGPGQWQQLPESLRHTFVRNAATYLDELLDPDCLDVDLDTLALYSKPALLTQGDQSRRCSLRSSIGLHNRCHTPNGTCTSAPDTCRRCRILRTMHAYPPHRPPGIALTRPPHLAPKRWTPLWASVQSTATVVANPRTHGHAAGRARSCRVEWGRLDRRVVCGVSNCPARSSRGWA